MNDDIDSEFERTVAANASLSDWCSQVEARVRSSAADEVEAVEQSEQLTKEDFSIYINARTDNSLAAAE